MYKMQDYEVLRCIGYIIEYIFYEYITVVQWCV